MECITKLLHGLGFNWRDMPTSSWVAFLMDWKPETLEANTANLVKTFSADALPRMVKWTPTIVSVTAERVEGTIQVLTSALGVSREAVSALVVKYPCLLRDAPSTLTGAIVTLARIPELGPAVALELCMHYPMGVRFSGNLMRSGSHCTASQQ